MKTSTTNKHKILTFMSHFLIFLLTYHCDRKTIGMNLKWPSKPLGREPRHQTNIDTALVDLCIGPYTYKTQGSNLSPLFGGLFLLKTDLR